MPKSNIKWIQNFQDKVLIEHSHSSMVDQKWCGSLMLLAWLKIRYQTQLINIEVLQLLVNQKVHGIKNTCSFKNKVTYRKLLSEMYFKYCTVKIYLTILVNGQSCRFISILHMPVKYMQTQMNYINNAYTKNLLLYLYIYHLSIGLFCI